MKLYEYEGAALFAQHGIAIPEYQRITDPAEAITITPPLVIKAQVQTSDRKRAGGILFAETAAQASAAVADLLEKRIKGERVRSVIVAKKVAAVAEYYASFSYDTQSRSPVLAITPQGGTGTATASVFPIDMTVGLQPFMVREMVVRAGFPSADVLRMTTLILQLWGVFMKEPATLVEINPILKTESGELLAADAKVMLSKRRQVEPMGGDIAIMASGGGASLVNIDALLAAGGRPANYTEYSGNPKAEHVTELTKQVLAQRGLKGCWVVGGTANFTDIYETLRGFLEGLKQLPALPDYPIVIRRGGPRQAEAAALVAQFAKEHGLTIRMYGSETPMTKTAKVMVALAYAPVSKPKKQVKAKAKVKVKPKKQTKKTVSAKKPVKSKRR
jgi:succinyl-CoA synthetase beta subunit